MYKKNYKRSRSVNPDQKIQQLKEQLRRTQDPIEREHIAQSIEHWTRVQNSKE